MRGGRRQIEEWRGHGDAERRWRATPPEPEHHRGPPILRLYTRPPRDLRSSPFPSYQDVPPEPLPVAPEPLHCEKVPDAWRRDQWPPKPPWVWQVPGRKDRRS